LNIIAKIARVDIILFKIFFVKQLIKKWSKISGDRGFADEILGWLGYK
jgi:hypothetical protein